jgi:hypothetical protein
MALPTPRPLTSASTNRSSSLRPGQEGRVGEEVGGEADLLPFNLGEDDMGEGRVAEEGLVELLPGRPDGIGCAVELGLLPDEAKDQGDVSRHGRSGG